MKTSSQKTKTCGQTAPNLVGAVLLVLLLLTAWPHEVCFAGAEKYPGPIGYVSDFANAVQPPVAEKIKEICLELEHKTGAQIAVASFPDMGGDEIDGFTNKIFEQWKLGQKGKDNGLLIMDAIKERQIRIEVGYGLESIITDAEAGRVRRELMNPLLKENKHGEAYLAGIAAFAGIIAKQNNVTLESLAGIPQLDSRPRREKSGKGGISQFLFLFPILILYVLSRLFGNRRGRGNHWGGGGYWGGGGFGGGGFGGGGGGFGGFGGGGSGGGGSSGGY